ncbi:MAG: DUF6160 family protein [Candidatus Macondimonas sp.]
MNTITQSTIFAAVAALSPLAAQAEMIELSDAELSAVQGQYYIETTSAYFQDYWADLGLLWTDLTTVEGKSAALHYVGWGTIMTGYAIRAGAWGTARAVSDFAQPPAPPPPPVATAIQWTVLPAVIPPMIVGGTLELTGSFIVTKLNGEN